MKIEDVRVGMKVVPHSHSGSFSDDWNRFFVTTVGEHFKKDGFLTVREVYGNEVDLAKEGEITHCSGFRASDFEPEVIEVGDEVVDRDSPQRGIVNAVRGDLVCITWRRNNLVGKLEFPISGFDLVRKAHCIKPEAVEEAEPKAPETVRLAWVRRCDSDDLHLYKVPDGANVDAGDTVLAPPKGVKLRGVVDEVRTVSKADATFVLRGQQPMVVPFIVGKVVTETKEVLFDD